MSFEDSSSTDSNGVPDDTVGSEDYIPDSDDDGGKSSHMKPVNGVYESPNKARRQSKPKRKNVPN